TKREEIVGRGLFDVFPDNPDDPDADGTSNLRQSLKNVIKKKMPDKMQLQKYDIPKPAEDGGGFEVRYWDPVNSPVLDQENKVTAIIHRVDDVTEFVTSREASVEQARGAFNMLNEKLHLIRKNEARVNHILDILLRYTMMDFAEKMDVSETGDEVDAIALGLNTLAEELEHYILQLRKSEEAMAQSNYFLNTILENIPNMVFVKDAKDLRFISFNKAGEDLIGFTREQLLGKNDYDFFPKEQAEQFTAKDREVLDEKGYLNIEEEPIETSKGARWLHTQKIAISDSLGKPLYLMGISEDITSRKEQADHIRDLNRNLESNLRQLEAVNKELEAFSYSVSHDLRAPLRAINGYAQMMEEDFGSTLDEEGSRILATIKYNASRMGTLIDDLLTFSRLGRKEIQRSRINMVDLVEGVQIEIGKSIKHNADVRVHQLCEVDGDYALLHQVVFNLVTNAIKYSSKSEAPVIDISCVTKDNEIVFSVKDNGVGFNMQYYSKLFGVFQRLHSSDEFEGTGVGLAIVQRVIAKHGGRVWADGKTGEGATFCFSLPKTMKH
ncbi:MAG TPA: ATP-binding protein, partial [Bacteroidia bacterium]|nr:ATP-binding protein [Bacteroidia bacterium]